MGPKEANDAVNKKISMIRMKNSYHKSALMKKYRKAITEKLIAIFDGLDIWN